MKKPYLNKIKQIGDISVWLVDGEYVRNNIDVDFTNFGHHYSYDFIPDCEFWIGKENSLHEQRFYIDHMLVEQRLMKEGREYEDAWGEADKVQRRERAKANHNKKVNISNDFIKNNVHKRLMKKYSTENITVWLVHGKKVRDYIDVDFFGGGHDIVFSYIPKGEIWIDDDLFIQEQKYILLHEVVERNLMAKGHPYWIEMNFSFKALLCRLGILKSSHHEANIKENYYRHHKDELENALIHEINKIK